MPESELGVVRDQLQGTSKANGGFWGEEVVRIGGGLWRESKWPTYTAKHCEAPRSPVSSYSSNRPAPIARCLPEIEVLGKQIVILEYRTVCTRNPSINRCYGCYTARLQESDLFRQAKEMGVLGCWGGCCGTGAGTWIKVSYLGRPKVSGSLGTV